MRGRSVIREWTAAVQTKTLGRHSIDLSGLAMSGALALSVVLPRYTD